MYCFAGPKIVERVRRKHKHLNFPLWVFSMHLLLNDLFDTFADSRNKAYSWILHNEVAVITFNAIILILTFIFITLASFNVFVAVLIMQMIIVSTFNAFVIVVSKAAFLCLACQRNRAWCLNNNEKQTQ
jgi:hypothetical protein